MAARTGGSGHQGVLGQGTLHRESDGGAETFKINRTDPKMKEIRCLRKTKGCP